LPQDTRVEGTSVRISEALEMFTNEYILLRGLAPDTQENYELAVLSFKRVCGDLDINKIEPKHIIEWRTFMNGRYTASTTRGYLSKLKNILKFTNKKGITNFDLDNIPLPKIGQALPKYLTREEVTRLIEACEYSRDKAIIALMFSAGLRSGEVSRLNRSDIYDSILTVNFSKNHKSRVTYIDDRTKHLLAEYLKERKDCSDALFYSAKCCRLTTARINKIIKFAADEAKIGRRVHAHMIRHSFATNLLSGGMDIRYIQELMGHSFVSTTQIYTHVIQSDTRAKYLECFKTT
jgi:site-specific recombinase XerD